MPTRRKSIRKSLKKSYKKTSYKKTSSYKKKTVKARKFRKSMRGGKQNDPVPFKDIISGKVKVVMYMGSFAALDYLGEYNKEKTFQITYKSPFTGKIEVIQKTFSGSQTYLFLELDFKEITMDQSTIYKSLTGKDLPPPMPSSGFGSSLKSLFSSKKNRDGEYA